MSALIYKHIHIIHEHTQAGSDVYMCIHKCMYTAVHREMHTPMCTHTNWGGMQNQACCSLGPLVRLPQQPSPSGPKAAPRPLETPAQALANKTRPEQQLLPCQEHRYIPGQMAQRRSFLHLEFTHHLTSLRATHTDSDPRVPQEARVSRSAPHLPHWTGAWTQWAQESPAAP